MSFKEDECGFCKSTVRPDATVCPYCGAHKGRISNISGFWLGLILIGIGLSVTAGADIEGYFNAEMVWYGLFPVAGGGFCFYVWLKRSRRSWRVFGTGLILTVIGLSVMVAEVNKFSMLAAVGYKQHYDPFDLGMVWYGLFPVVAGVLVLRLWLKEPSTRSWLRRD